jgi:hypothetical protein
MNQGNVTGTDVVISIIKFLVISIIANATMGTFLGKYFPLEHYDGIAMFMFIYSIVNGIFWWNRAERLSSKQTFFTVLVFIALNKIILMT